MSGMRGWWNGCRGLLAAVVLATGFAEAQTVRSKLVFCPKATGPVTLDGDLSESAWQHASVYDDFGFLKWGSAAGKTPDQMPRTVGRLMYDDENLYMAYECFEPGMTNLHAQLLENRSIFWGDCLEIYIDTQNDGKGYVGLWANAKGDTMSESRIDRDWAVETDNSFSLWARYHYGYKLTDTGWIVEAAIAWEDMDVVPEAGKIMGFNPCRFRFCHKIPQYLSWSTIGSGQKDPQEYGHMVLGDRPADITPILRRLYPLFDQLTVQVPKGTTVTVFEKGHQAADATYADFLAKQLVDLQQRLETARQAAIGAPPHSVVGRNFATATNNLTVVMAEARVLGDTVTESDYLRLATRLDEVSAGLRMVEGEAAIAALQAALAGTSADDKAVVEAIAAKGALDGAKTLANIRPADAAEWEDRAAALEPEAIIWANPVAGKIPRVLFLAHDAAVGEAACVARRLQMEWKVIGWPPPWGSLSDTQAAEFRLALEQGGWDVLVVGNPVNLGKASPELRQLLLERQIQGMGLVGYGKLSPQEMKQGWSAVGVEAIPAVPFDDFEVLAASTNAPADRLDAVGSFVPMNYVRQPSPINPGASLQFCETGPIRQARLPFSAAGWGVHTSFISAPGGEYPPDQWINDQYYMSALCKAIRWAARVQPEVCVTAVRAAYHVAVGEKISVSVGLRATAPLAGARLEWEVVDTFLQRVASDRQNIAVAIGESETILTLPELDAGRYFINVWLKLNDTTVDWGSAVVRAQHPAAVSAITLSKTGYARGESVAGRVTLRNVPAAGATLSLRVVDMYERIVAQTDLPAVENDQTFSFPIAPEVDGIAFDLRAAIIGDDGRVLATGNAEFPIRRSTPDFIFNNCIADDRAPAYLMRIRQRLIRRHRPDTDNYENDSAYTALRVARNTGIASQSRPFLYGGLVGAEKMADFIQKIKRTTHALSPQGLLYINTGDDTHPATSVPPEHMDAFQKYLKARYKTLEAIRTVWGKEFSDWSAVTNNYVASAKATGNLAPNTDMLSFCEKHFYDGLGKLKNEAQKINPAVAVGQFAVGGFGNDFQSYLEVCNYFAPYYRDAIVEQVGSFYGRAPGFYGSNGGYHSDEGAPNPRFKEPWYTLLSGGNIVHHWYTPARLGHELDIPPLTAGIWYDAAREIGRGIGMQALRTPRVNDPVAILWSTHSGYASAYEMALGEEALGEIQNARAVFNQIIADLGLQYTYIGDKHLTDGVLKKEGFKLLVLPYCQALSSAEAAAVRAFVEQGGTVLADIRPGVWDDLCRRPPQGQLDDVFGVTRDPVAKAAGGGDLTVAAAFPGLTAGTRIDQAKVDRAVTTTTAKAYGEVDGTPALLVNQFGKGTAVLINTYVGRYTICRNADAATPWLAFYRWIFQQAGLEVDRVAVAVDGRPALGVRRVHHREGAVEWLGVYKTGLSSETYPVRIDFTLPEARYVYDVRSGAYLGHSQTFAAPFDAMETRYFSLLPYRVKSVKLSLPRRVSRGTVVEARAELQTDGDNAAVGNHAFLVTVTGDDGVEIPCFEQRVWAEQGQAAIRLPLAFNEKPGSYTLVVRDVPTGVTASQRFILR